MIPLPKFESVTDSSAMDVLSDAITQVCSDPKILNAKPHMIPYCCPEWLDLPTDPTDVEKKERQDMLDVCYNARSGMSPLRPDSVESKNAQELIETIFGELCLNNRFNTFRTDLCCFVDGSTHQSVGLSGDNQDVARACALPRL